MWPETVRLLTDPQVQHGLLQIGTASLLVVAVLLVGRWRDVAVGREVTVAMVRGLAQVVAAGVVLTAILSAPLAAAVVVLGAMMVVAAGISRRRAAGLPGGFAVSFYAIGLGAGLTIVVMTLAGVIESTMSGLVPVGSMLIANAMRANSQTLERFRAEVTSHVAQIEAGLALGAPPSMVVAPYVSTTIRASILPVVDTLRSLGIVFIPGLMTGMILAGANPIYAAEYQFAVMAMIFAASALTAMVSGLLIRASAFTAAEQLRLRPQLMAQS
jgi:putative ABC transport system permease protein